MFRKLALLLSSGKCRKHTVGSVRWSKYPDITGLINLSDDGRRVSFQNTVSLTKEPSSPW
jgi:hypothetical protein